MRFFPTLLTALTVVATTAGPSLASHRELTELDDASVMAFAAKKKFSWEGSCEIQCSDGKCRLVCGAGIVYSNSAFEARLQAEASLRQQASGQGTVKEGTIRITIRGGF